MLVAGVVFGDDAGGASSAEVLPSPIGVNYGQTVQVKGHNLPHGSGSAAVTICGLEDAAGTKIETPGGTIAPAPPSSSRGW